MELFQSAELQTNEVQNGWSSVLWFGATLAVVWVASISSLALGVSVDALLTQLGTFWQTILAH